MYMYNVVDYSTYNLIEERLIKYCVVNSMCKFIFIFTSLEEQGGLYDCLV